MSWEKRAFGITVDPNMLLVHARLIAPPMISYCDDRSLTPRLADWNMIGKEFFKGIQMTRWSYLNLSDKELSKQSLTGFRDALKVCGMGQEIPHPSMEFKAQLPGNGDDDQNDELIRGKMEEMSKNEVGIVLVILPSRSAPLYARVKFWADVKFGMI